MQRAVVIGASLSGSMCARLLADSFDEVVVLERDHSIGETGPRQGVPQGRHLHALWYTGLAAMDALFPGLVDEMAADGAVVADAGWDFGWWRLGARRAPVRTGRPSVGMSRPFLEHKVRSRALAIPNVSLRLGRALGLTATAGKVDGVLVSAPDDERNGTPQAEDERLEAELVLDCSGRGSQLANWLVALGYRPPATEQVAMEMGYATRFLHRQPGQALADGTTGLACLAALPGQPRSVILLAIEGERWLLGTTSYGQDRPGKEEDDFNSRCREQKVPPLDKLLDGAEPAGDIVTHRMPTSLRRDYAAMPAFPAGLLAAGDSIASFNPVYGQGMTCAAMHAQALQGYLARGGAAARDTTSAAGYFRQVKKVTDAAWALSVTEDFRLPSTRGKRPPGAALSHRLGDLYAAASLSDASVHRRFLSVASLESSPLSLMAPGALASALIARGKHRQ